MSGDDLTGGPFVGRACASRSTIGYTRQSGALDGRYPGQQPDEKIDDEPGSDTASGESHQAAIRHRLDRSVGWQVGRHSGAFCENASGAPDRLTRLCSQFIGFRPPGRPALLLWGSHRGAGALLARTAKERPGHGGARSAPGHLRGACSRRATSVLHFHLKPRSEPMSLETCGRGVGSVDQANVLGSPIGLWVLPLNERQCVASSASGSTRASIA